MARAHDKGREAENQTVDMFVAWGVPAERRRPQHRHGGMDRLDLTTGIVGYLCDVKWRATPRVPEWVRNAEVRRKSDGADIAVVLHKDVRKTDAHLWSAWLDPFSAANLIMDGELLETSTVKFRGGLLLNRLTGRQMMEELQASGRIGGHHG